MHALFEVVSLPGYPSKKRREEEKEMKHKKGEAATRIR
jgi:hypothetical protein